MPIVSPQIKQGKKNRQDFIEYLTSLIPATQMPNPPGMEYATPATWQEGLRPIVDMLVPQPEDTMMNVGMPYFLRFTGTPKADVKRGYSHIATGDKQYLNELNAIEDNKYKIVKFGKNSYGLRTEGLNGYGPYNTIDEALADAENVITQNSKEPWVDSALHLFKGDYITDDPYSYPLFKVIEHVKKISSAKKEEIPNWIKEILEKPSAIDEFKELWNPKNK